ncbi:MAG: hypothetical protein ACRC5C_05720 [Bacilli bacterium]
MNNEEILEDNEMVFPPDDVGALALGVKGTLVIIAGYVIVIIGYVMELLANEWEYLNAVIARFLEQRERNKETASA